MLGVFGKFTLLDKIAEGGMAEVFRASVRDQRGYDSIVAIKRLHRSLCDDDELTEMLADEARLTVQLDHPSIGRVYDLGVYDQQSFLIMEFIDGPDLQFLLERFALQGQNFPTLAALYAMSQTLGALHYAHTRRGDDGAEMNIVHRDVSPQNIMIDVNGVVRIVDFGIAKAKDRLVQTQHGIIKGKYFYMSPEQAMGHHVDARSDVFSVGMVLYELLAGQSPYQDLPDVKLLKTVRRADFPPLSQYCPQIDPEIVDVIERATTRDAERRFSSALEFKHALDGILQRIGGPLPPDLSRLVRHFVSPTVDVGKILKPGSYRTSSESIIFQLSDSELIDLRPSGYQPKPSVSKPAPQPPMPNTPRQKTEASKSGISQTRLIVLLLAMAGFMVIIALTVIYLKKDKEAVAVANVGDIENSKTLTGSDSQAVPVAFVTTPANAIVVVNGVESGTTPLSISLNVGEKYEVSLKKDGFETFEKELLVANEMEINETLNETRRVVSLMSYPSDAKITVNGKPEGNTPIMISGFDENVDIKIVATTRSGSQTQTIKWADGDAAVKEVMFEFRKNRPKIVEVVSLTPLEKEGAEEEDVWDDEKPKPEPKKEVAKKVVAKVVKKTPKKTVKKTVRKKVEKDDDFDPWGDTKTTKKKTPKKVVKKKVVKKKPKKVVEDDW